LRAFRLGRFFGVIVMNDGQSPSRHEKSRLHVVWSISVLRPNGVSIGCTDRQLLTSPQWPQPSQMRWLITTRWSGAAILPRLRSRRALAAHTWSWISTVTPGSARAAAAPRAAACAPHLDAVGQRGVRHNATGSSAVISTRLTPCVSRMRATCGTASCPCGSWPPVIATVPL
jgi:hypothetical protein